MKELIHNFISSTVSTHNGICVHSSAIYLRLSLFSFKLSSTLSFPTHAMDPSNKIMSGPSSCTSAMLPFNIPNVPPLRRGDETLARQLVNAPNNPGLQAPGEVLHQLLYKQEACFYFSDTEGFSVPLKDLFTPRPSFPYFEFAEDSIIKNRMQKKRDCVNYLVYKYFTGNPPEQGNPPVIEGDMLAKY